MAEVIRIYGRELDGLVEDLSMIYSNFYSADLFAETAAQHAGHDVLAGSLREFARGWDDRREKILGGVEFLRDGVRAMRDTVQEIDQSLAADLQTPSGTTA